MRETTKSIILSSNESELIANIYPPIVLDPSEHHELALVSLDMYHSIPNVDEDNSLFRYEYNNSKYEIEIPTGSYEIEAINNYIKKQLSEKGHDDIFNIKANANTLKSIITINDNTVKIDFEGERSMRTLLGFDCATYSGVGEHEGLNIVDIITVNSIRVNYNVIDGSYINSIQ